MDLVQVLMCGEHADAELAPLFPVEPARPVSMSHYSRALDEIYRLRTILAYEAMVTDAHHEGYKTSPKSRKRSVVEQAERMRRAARGDTLAVFNGISYPKQALQDAGAAQTLTRAAWEADDNARCEVSND